MIRRIVEQTDKVIHSNPSHGKKIQHIHVDVAVSVCGLSGLWPFRFVAVPVCDRFGLWPFRFVAVSVCGRSGLWPFQSVAVSVCGRYDLLPTR